MEPKRFGFEYALLMKQSRIVSDKLPESYSETMSRPDANMWAEACDFEYKTLADRGTWKLVKAPKGRKTVNPRWVLAAKCNDKGKIVR